jgi:type II secretory pathway pseudopilin PulG
VRPTNAVARAAARGGATLIELLVVMALIAALGALALMLLPSIANSDNTLKAASSVQATCKISQGMAGAARGPRGVRFLVGQAGTTDQFVARQMQFLEAPPIMVPDPQALVAKAADPNGVALSVQTNTVYPRVEFLYFLDKNNNVANRQCFIIGLTTEQELQVAVGSTLILPTLGVWSRINATPTVLNPTPTTPRRLLVTLDAYPDANLGGATTFRTYHFGLYGPPAPLLGEPTIPLPRDIGVDLSISFPPLTTPGMDFDVMFSPSGQTVASPATATSQAAPANSAVFLWVRDVSKTDMTPISMPTVGSPNTPWVFDMTKFRLGGEQQVVGIRNGFVGSAPVQWPQANGTYNASENPYTLARSRLN